MYFSWRRDAWYVAACSPLTAGAAVNLAIAFRIRSRWPPIEMPMSFSILVIDLAEQVHTDFIGIEGIGIWANADLLQPFADLAHALSCSSSDLASFKSSVSNPSVNQS